MYIAIRWVVHALILLAVVKLGQMLGLGINIQGFAAAVIVVFLLALANAVVRPIMHTLLLPLNCLTLGLLGFAVNVLVLWLVSAGVGPKRFDLSFGGAVYCSVCLSFFGAIANRYIRPKRED